MANMKARAARAAEIGEEYGYDLIYPMTREELDMIPDRDVSALYTIRLLIDRIEGRDCKQYTPDPAADQAAIRAYNSKPTAPPISIVAGLTDHDIMGIVAAYGYGGAK